MRREIKFRAWLPAIEKMTYAHTLEELMNWNTNPKDNGLAIWLQYTGLKDFEDNELVIDWQGILIYWKEVRNHASKRAAIPYSGTAPNI